MNERKRQGTWDELQGFGRAIWGELTGDGREFSAGLRQRLIGRLEARSGLSRAEAEAKVDELRS